MALAFGCMILAIAILAIISTASTAIRYGPQHYVQNIDAWPVFLLFAFPGWILALPFVIFFENADGWHAWAILAIGTAIGPCFLFGWALIASHGRIAWQSRGADNFAVVMSLLISFLTTGLYVVLLRRSERKLLARSLD
jgi:hypothetical protein